MLLNLLGLVLFAIGLFAGMGQGDAGVAAILFAAAFLCVLMISLWRGRKLKKLESADD
ncbi:hypothetical protein H6786_00670 [Candidatus Nomurabacteria bacterium]|nr:hypothetical protein [Candidatus Nomurabacteria bacterium]